MKFFLIIFIFLSLNLSAHKPNLVKDSPSASKPHLVVNPEISKVYYGKLSGSAHYYKLDTDKKFLFYTGILTPKINKKNKWFSVDVFDENNNIIYEADGSNYEWKEWYEPYSKDWYWKGPEIGSNVNEDFKVSFTLEAGTYLIKVYNENNSGAYSLAIGEQEFFGIDLWEQIVTWVPIIFYINPYIEIFYWSKFDIRSYIPHISFIILLFFIKKIFFKKRRRRYFSR